MNHILQPVDDLLNNQEQAIVLLKAQLDALNSVTVYDHLEQTPWIVAPGTAANTGSVGSTATPSQWQPGVNCAGFRIEPHGPYADSYFYKKLGADAAKKAFKLEVSFLFGSLLDVAASQAIELDIQQVIGGTVFNTGLQFDFAENSLRVWNRSGKAWMSTGLPCLRWIPNQWKRVILETHRDDKSVWYDAVTLDGMRQTVNNVIPSVQLPLPDMLNCAIQLDSNKAGTAYQVYVDAVRFSAA